MQSIPWSLRVTPTASAKMFIFIDIRYIIASGPHEVLSGAKLLAKDIRYEKT